jgi:hypothetical protein
MSQKTSRKIKQNKTAATKDTPRQKNITRRIIISKN